MLAEPSKKAQLASVKQNSQPVRAGAGLSQESRVSDKNTEMKRRQGELVAENSSSPGRKTRSYMPPAEEADKKQRRLCNLETTAQTANMDVHHIEATCSQFTL